MADERVTVTLPNGSSDDAAGERVALPAEPVGGGRIGRGENRGRTITYTNVVRRWVKLGTWSGKGETLTVPIDAIKAAGIDGFAVIVQSGNAEKPGPDARRHGRGAALIRES